MHAIDQKQLETICVYALNKVQRTKPVNEVQLEQSLSGHINWTLRKIEPRLALVDVRKSYKIIRALQREYQLGKAS
jgi:hypothetical protein